MKEKKRVRCRIITVLPPVVGKNATIETLDHPEFGATQMKAGYVTVTSIVQKINADGSFETLNTLYIPEK